MAMPQSDKYVLLFVFRVLINVKTDIKTIKEANDSVLIRVEYHIAGGYIAHIKLGRDQMVWCLGNKIFDSKNKNIVLVEDKHTRYILIT